MKRKEDEKKMDLLIARTLAFRREKLFDETFALSDYFQEFPYMMDEKEILNEFGRLYGSGEGISCSFSSFLSSYAEALFILMKGSKCAHEEPTRTLMKNIRKMNTEQAKYATCVVAIFSVISHFREPLPALKGSSVPEPRDSPIFIQYNENVDFIDQTEFNVYVDGIKVCEISDFVGAFMVFLASFYVFNISFTKCLKKSLKFFAMAALKISDKTKLNEKRMTTLISKLHGLTNAAATTK